jgi:alpha-tubulin suppressor-like RCC1 family protein
MDNDPPYFSSLSNDQIIDIALQLNVSDLGYYCLYNLRFNDIICNNQWFWEQKFLLDFGPAEYDFVDDWKSLYKNYGSVYAFGNNEFGQLGLVNEADKRTSTPTKIPRFNVKTISAGRFHTVAIDFNYDVWTFGDNEFGQLGLGNTVEDQMRIPTKMPGFKFKAISAGGKHTAAIDFNDEVWTFGHNSKGQLGLGNRETRLTPTKIPFEAFDLPNFKARSIVAGYTHTIVLDFTDDVWTFGNNKSGQLGLGHIISMSIPTKILGFKFKSVSAGGSHTVALDFDNNAWVFGSNGFGQLGLGDNITRNVPTLLPNFRFKEIVAGENHTVAIDFDDNVWTFGNNGFGRLGLGDTNQRLIPTKIPNFKVKSVRVGHSSTFALDFDDNVWAFGNNFWSQLGVGDRRDRLTPTKIENFKAKDISAGVDHTIALSDHEF